jgi:hypothetical protein
MYVPDKPGDVSISWVGPPQKYSNDFDFGNSLANVVEHIWFHLLSTVDIAAADYRT